MSRRSMGGEATIAVMDDTLRVTAVVLASADRVYAAWLDGAEHTRMTGGKATVDPSVGGEHTAWDGYIMGKTLGLDPGRRIVQSWRTTDFPLNASDSRLEVHLLDVEGGCEVTILQTEIPEGQGAKYEAGWREHYFVPMAKYFGKSRAASSKKAAKRAVTKKKAAKKAVPAKAAKKTRRVKRGK
jgi:uncharacterized protein YndB with AHSA1/START domain